MLKIKTSVTISEDILKWIDLEIKKKRFASKSHAVEYCVHRVMKGKIS